MIVGRNISVCGWSPFQKRSGIPPHLNNHYIESHIIISVLINNEMTTPKSFHDMPTLIENLSGFIAFKSLYSLNIFPHNISIYSVPTLQLLPSDNNVGS